MTQMASSREKCRDMDFIQKIRDFLLFCFLSGRTVRFLILMSEALINTFKATVGYRSFAYLPFGACMIPRTKMGSAEMAMADDAFSVCAYRKLATIFEITTLHRHGRGIFVVFCSVKMNKGMCAKTDVHHVT